MHNPHDTRIKAKKGTIINCTKKKSRRCYDVKNARKHESGSTRGCDSKKQKIFQAKNIFRRTHTENPPTKALEIFLRKQCAIQIMF